MTRLYRDRRFATYWTGQAVSELGDRVSELALPLIAITILGASSIEVGVLTAAVWAPQLLSLLMGAWVDQQQHKRQSRRQNNRSVFEDAHTYPDLVRILHQLITRLYVALLAAHLALQHFLRNDFRGPPPLG